MSKPSKLPWKLRRHAALGCFIEGPKAKDMPYALEVMGDDYNGYGDDEQREADAAFIVKACNSHDELVAQLKAVRDQIKESEYWWMDCPNKGGFDLETIESTLAKLEEA